MPKTRLRRSRQRKSASSLQVSTRAPFDADFLVEHFGSVPGGFERFVRDREPHDIAEARRWCKPFGGTSSVLDMHEIRDRPEPGFVLALSPVDLPSRIGTEPTHAQLFAFAEDPEDPQRDHGFAAAYFENGHVAGYLIWGISGD